MGELDKKLLTFGPDAMNQYTALGNELRFYADQRFKIATAFLVANTLLANVAKDYKSMSLAIIGMALSLLCMVWDRKTAEWWGRLLEALKCIEKTGVQEGKLALGYERYEKSNKLWWKRLNTPSGAIGGIYAVSAVAWLVFLFRSYPQWWERLPTK
jgi:hypothetical protein